MSGSVEFLTPAEVGRACRVSAGTVRHWARTGQIPTIRLPSGRWRIPLDALASVQHIDTPTTADHGKHRSDRRAAA